IVALAEIRGGLPARVRRRTRGATRDRRLLRLLQRRAPASSARLQRAVGSLFLVAGGITAKGRVMCTVDSQHFTSYRSPPAPPSTEQITAAEIVDCVHGVRYRSNQTQSSCLRSPFRGPDDGFHPCRH